MSTYTQMRSIIAEVEKRHKNHKPPPYPRETPTWGFVIDAMYQNKMHPVVGGHDEYGGLQSHLGIHWLEHQAMMVRQCPRHWLVWLWYETGYIMPRRDDLAYLARFDKEA